MRRIKGDAIRGSLKGLEFKVPTGRFRRWGLPRPQGSKQPVRCECNHCGAHLYVVPYQGRLIGTCVICGGTSVRPVD